MSSLPTELRTIQHKVERQERLTAQEALRLTAADVDLHWLGSLADRVRRRKHGDVAFYQCNAHINPTNVCTLRCPLCAYSRDATDPTAFVLSLDQILQQADEAHRAGCTDLHIVSGIHPALPYSFYRNILTSLRAAYPRMRLKAWTAAEIVHFANLEQVTVEAILADLIDAGLGSLPGGGAEIFDRRIRHRIAPQKIDSSTWLDVHRTAHRLGLRSNATMLYGHLESPHHWVDHLLRLRTLQDETSGFDALVPLSFHPSGTPLATSHGLRGPSAETGLRVVALSRLVLDNFEHIKAYWVSLGVGTAQVALNYGADDLDGTVRRERIHHDAGSTAPTGLSADTLRQLIVESGHRPTRCDSLYQRVE